MAQFCTKARRARDRARARRNDFCLRGVLSSDGGVSRCLGGGDGGIPFHHRKVRLRIQRDGEVGGDFAVGEVGEDGGGEDGEEVFADDVVDVAGAGVGFLAAGGDGVGDGGGEAELDVVALAQAGGDVAELEVDDLA